MVLRMCGELPTLKITRVGVGVGWGGVGWDGVEGGAVGWCGMELGGVSYQRLNSLVLRICGELPMLNMHAVKGLW